MNAQTDRPDIESEDTAVEGADHVVSVSMRLLKLFVENTNQQHYSVRQHGARVRGNSALH